MGAGLEEIEIADVQDAVEVRIRQQLLHEGIDERAVLERVPQQEFTGRRQRQVLAQVEDDEQLRSMAGGEDAHRPIDGRLRGVRRKRTGRRRDGPCLALDRDA
jgi:hypothetical protein